VLSGRNTCCCVEIIAAYPLAKAAKKELIVTAKRFSPFKNEADTLRIGDLLIENHFNRISLNGRLEITLDQAGLDAARVLLDVLSLTLHELAHTALPDRIGAAAPENVRSPNS